MIYFIRIITITFVLLLVSGCVESESKETTDSGTTTKAPTTPDKGSSPKTATKDDNTETTTTTQKPVVINGHTLPPMPDKTLNDSTLLGIDSNNNGVRDDVEIWIYETYKDKHPIHIDIAMQAGRAYKQVLETPERAKEIREKVNGPLFCASYYEFEAQFFGDPVLIYERIDAPVKSKYFNTKERNEVYWQYDTLLSGDSYPLPKDNEMKSFCDFNTTKYK
jgi:hypothetical protein